MKDYFLRSAAGAVLLFLPVSAQVIESQCGLQGADTLLTSGLKLKKCLDLSTLDSQSVVIPSNVVRIDNTGFALCENSQQDGGAVDIAYVLDQSGSMGVGAAWISPDKSDTVYLQNPNCPGFTNADRVGNLTIPTENGVRTVPILNPNKSIASCNTTSGDPFEQRGNAFKEAIDFQAQRAPTSTAAYLGFSDNVLNPVRPLKLNTQANIDRLKQSIQLRYEYGTNYEASLDTAKRWLLNPALASNPTQAVIFLSDGRPYPENQNPFAVIDSAYARQPGKMPPVYGIFLGQPTADTTFLDSISRLTGGKFYLIPPSRPDSLKAVVGQILNIILRRYQPVGAVVTNNSIPSAPPASAGQTAFSKQPDGTWLIGFDRTVPLNRQAENQIKLETRFMDQTGLTQAKTINFSLLTTGPDESTNKNLPGTQFGVSCVDLPPPVDKIKLAYIKDVNGDGAGDLVVVVFSWPLASLPTSLDAYWNDSLAAFKNKAPPKLSFLTASGNTVVLADFSASPFLPAGMTSIPAGAHPKVVLPPGGVFGGQAAELQDSIGPILIGGAIRPFDAAKADPGAAINLDTVTVTVSEPIRTKSQWNTVLVWSKAVNGVCSDYAHALPLLPAQAPTVDVGGTTVTVLVSNADGPAPSKDDCVYLNTDGTYSDLKYNLPPEHGVVLQGPARSRQIELFRGYPPVVGLDANNPGFTVTNQDPRQGDDPNGYSVLDPLTGKYTVTWIPPYGYVQGLPFYPPIPAVNAPAVGTEDVGPSPMPPGISAIQVVSTGKYIADISIYDNRGNFMRRLMQSFGYHGELANRNRIARKGQVSYLVWDLKDERGQKAGVGVYIWKVVFSFETGKQEVQYTRTGVIRHPGWQWP